MEQPEKTTDENKRDAFRLYAPFIFPLLLLTYAILNYKWEHILLVTGIVFPGYLALLRAFEWLKSDDWRHRSFQFSVVSLLAMLGLWGLGEKKEPEDCKPTAQAIFDHFKQKDKSLNFPGNIDEQFRGINLANFDEQEILGEIRLEQGNLLRQIAAEHCEQAGKSESACETLLACVQTTYRDSIARRAKDFVAEAKRCLNLSYDLNIYLENPGAAALEQLNRKYGITQRTEVRDVSQPGIPTTPADGRFVSWFLDPGLYGYHTVKVIRCIQPRAGTNVSLIELIKIN